MTPDLRKLVERLHAQRTRVWNNDQELCNARELIAEAVAALESLSAEMPEYPNIIRLRNGFSVNADGNQVPTFGEYVLRTDYDKLAAHCAGLRRDAERLDYLESLTGRMYAHTSGKIWPLTTDIVLKNFKECSATIYLRDECGRNAQTASGATVRDMLDSAMKGGKDGQA